MSFLTYLFCTSLSKKHYDYKAWCGMRRLYDAAQHDCHKAELKISKHSHLHMDTPNSDFRAIPGVCISVFTVDSYENLISEDGRRLTLPLSYRFNCKNFSTDKLCDKRCCACHGANHEYVDSVQRVNVIRERLNEFWANKFKQM